MNTKTICISLFLLLFTQGASSAKAEESTRLRVIGKPVGTFETTFGTTDLKSASVKVRNVGTVEASKVVVTVSVPSGRSGRLHGPRTLAPNEVAVYSSDAVLLPVTSEGSLSAEATCSNCGTNRSTTGNQEATGPTTLRAAKPVGVFNTIGGTTYLIYAEIEVKNVGSSVAEDVRVQLELPNGKATSLSGPESIPPNKKRLYRSRLFEPIISTKRLKALTSCSNCR